MDVREPKSDIANRERKVKACEYVLDTREMTQAEDVSETNSIEVTLEKEREFVLACRGQDFV